jgi:hypothetical protein
MNESKKKVVVANLKEVPPYWPTQSKHTATQTDSHGKQNIKA